MRRFGNERMARELKRGVLYCLVSVLLVSAFAVVPQEVEAESGSITIAPGETKYLSFGSCAVGNVLLWDFDIDTWSTEFKYWLEGPTGVLVQAASTGYWHVFNPGEYKLGFSIDVSGIWSVTVSYTMYVKILEIEIESPIHSSFVNQRDLLVSGTVDGFTEVAVSLDDVHYEDADLHLESWNKAVTLPPLDGEYRIYAKATFQWDTFTLRSFSSVTVTLDTIMPEVTIVGPEDEGLVRDNCVDISWECSDGWGITTVEIKIDSWGWNEVSGYSYNDLRLATGDHTIQIRVTDLAGNQATDSTTFTVDARALSLDGPYYGIPLLGIIAAIIIGAVLAAMLYRKKRRGPAVPTAPEGLSLEQPPEGVPAAE